jgi:glyceraldehyde-3-phosphate dehydrogenase (NADP+)
MRLGRHVESDVLVVRDPDDGAVVGEVRTTGIGELDAAIGSAHAVARAEPPPPFERARVLLAVAARVKAAATEYAELIAKEGVKTIREAKKEVGRCVETLTLAAQEATRVGGGIVPMAQTAAGADRIAWFELRPAGVVAALTPFNDPLNLVAHKLAPAYAIGAPVILKPHPQTPLSALRLVGEFHECGAPVDRVQVVIGGADLGARLVADRRPRIVSFTGGRAAGESIARSAGCKRLLLELGGVGIVAVAADADVESAARAIHSGAFWAAGQNCVHAQRIIAARSVVDELRDRLVALASGMKLGAKLDPATDMGPLVDDAAVSRVEALVDSATAAGARLLAGGVCDRRRFAPTWLDRVPETHVLMREEVFGPVSTLESVAGNAELLHTLASGTDAIHAAVYTRSLDLALAVRRVANAAAVIVNDSTDFRVDAMPFGGIGAAGLGREGVADAMAEMSEKRLLVLRELSPR